MTDRDSPFRRLVGGMLGTALVIAVLGSTGCVSFSGPNDLRREIASAGNVELQEQEGVCVGPVGVALASVFVGSYLPVKLNGVSNVDFGEYAITPCDPTQPAFCLRSLELDGWEPVVRVHEPGSSTLVMINEGGNSVRALLVLNQDGDELQVVRARGNFDRMIENLFSSDLLDNIAGPEMIRMGLSP